ADAGAAIMVDERGRTLEASPIEKGTRVQVRDLFYNVPVRRDYYKNALKIRRQLSETITGLTTAHPGIAFRYRLGEADPVFLPCRDKFIERLADIWGAKIGDDLIAVYHEADGFILEG